MITMTLAEVAAAVAGRLEGDPSEVISSVAIDSRHVAAGGLFAALVGEQQDGHDYFPEALAAGASAVLCTRDVAAPRIVVPDVAVALGLLARAVHDRLPDLVTVGVTGSSGKTTTKDLIAHILRAHGSTVAPPGSLNNELGVPLTVFRCDDTTRFLVVEMGARGLGHISYLCGIAPPQVGVVLNVGSAHVGEFGNQGTIAAAKSELVAALPSTGIAVLNAEDPLVAAMREVTSAEVMTFGEYLPADVHVRDLTLDHLARPRFDLEFDGERVPVALTLSGEHMAINAAAAATVALALGCALTDVAALLSTAELDSRWRMEIATSPNGVVVVNDAYNANPESMRAALKALVAMAGHGRTWAVLGEMRELGDTALAAHDEIGRLAVRLDIGRLICVGDGARAMHLGAAQEGSWGNESMWVPDVATAIASVRQDVRPGDVVLVKASRAIGLEAVAEALLAPVEGGIPA